MQINETRNIQGVWIDDVGMEGICINGHCYRQPICITNRAVQPVIKSSVTELSAEDFCEAISYHPEIILIGTGRKTRFIDPRLNVELVQHGIGIECMSTDAACRTFSVLLGEGRNVWAWLWPLSD